MPREFGDSKFRLNLASRRGIAFPESCKMTQQTHPRIAVTMGDPAGIGPEVCLHLLRHGPSHEQGIPVVFGDASVLQAVAGRAGLPAPEVIHGIGDLGTVPLDRPCVMDLGSIRPGDFAPGEVSAAAGRSSFLYIDRAIDAALAGAVDGVCTAPINKEAIRRAGVTQPGHTEIFAEKTGAERACMMLTSTALTCSFVTVHVGYRDVPGLLSVERILDVIELTAEAMRRIRGREPKLLVCGLNPHAGEHGLFGDREEERFIIPAIEQARAQGLEIAGPLPPDTAFLPRQREAMDCFICMYHDQGHIPLKALAFDEAINITLGLPIIRTSVDHGTAFDIAWQGLANPNSLYEAFRLSSRLAGGVPAGS